MQKKLIALAIAGFAGTAFAQSNVTIYGVMDGSFESMKATGASPTAAGAGNNAQELSSRSRIVSNSSYFGLKGTEDLGGGLKALYQFETQFALDSAGDSSAGTPAGTAAAPANRLGNRDTFIGLTGNFGTAIMGYVSTPHRNLFAAMDVMPGATGVAGGNNLLGKINTGASINAAGITAATFANNTNTIFRSQAVAYVTPTFNGFSGVLAYIPNENKNSLDANDVSAAGAATTNTSAWNGALNYANGPIKAGYSYVTQKDPVAGGAALGGLAAGTGGKLTSHLFGAGYTFNGATTVNLVWNTNKISIDGTAANSFNMVKNRVWGLGVKHVMGAHEIAAMYQRANDGTVGVNGTDATVLAQDRGASNFGLRYGYNFSKRTQIYGVYSKITNKANGTYDFGAGLAANNTQGATAKGGNISAGADPVAFGVGLRHSF
jgi:predicted porin